MRLPASQESVTGGRIRVICWPHLRLGAGAVPAEWARLGPGSTTRVRRYLNGASADLLILNGDRARHSLVPGPEGDQWTGTHHGDTSPISKSTSGDVSSWQHPNTVEDWQDPNTVEDDVERRFVSPAHAVLGQGDELFGVRFARVASAARPAPW